MAAASFPVFKSSSPRLRTYLTVGYSLLIVYASLSPFTGWRDQGLTFSAVLGAPLWQTYTPFDALANLLAYIPFGLLLALTLLARFRGGWSVLLSALTGVLLSASMEYAQMYLPMRTSSNLDLLTNSAGALAGALLAMRIAPSAWFTALWRWRQELVRQGRGVDFGLALAALWMFAQVNPSLPMLGNIFIGEAARYPLFNSPAEPFNWLASAAVALNLLMLGCLLLTLLRKRRDALVSLALLLCLVAVCKFIAAALLLKSWALLLWLNSEAMLGIIAGLLLLAFATRLPGRHISLFAAFAALTYTGLAHGLLDGSVPSSVMRMYHLKDHLLTYHGMSHAILLLFPLLLLGYLWRSRKRQPDAV
jgi:VanZ family protein